MRRRFFRAVRFKLECGHTEDEVTSFYRMDRRRLSCLIGSMNRRGIWCSTCNALCQPTECLGTVRVSEVK